MARPPRISDIDDANKDCIKCLGQGWVCENHPDRVAHECPCGGAGMPCTCNPLFEKGIQMLTSRQQFDEASKRLEEATTRYNNISMQNTVGLSAEERRDLDWRYRLAQKDQIEAERAVAEIVHEHTAV